MVMLVILIMGGSAMLLNTLNSSTPQLARAKLTSDALAQAKEALIGHGTSLVLTSATYPDRPGDLPCPDMDNDGFAEGLCGSAAGSNQQLRLGRLPWKTLGLSDLRDGSGERLWYAVSNNFKKNTRTAILNSDTIGTITVRNSDGGLLNDGSSTSGAVAIILAPGEVLHRQGDVSSQNRTCTTGVNCDVQEKCTTIPPTLTPKCDPANYLDIANGEDNANFIDGSSNGFIQGKIKDATDKVILNDQILIISRDNIMQSIQKRVVKEVTNALNIYFNGNGFYPKPADFTDTYCLGNTTISPMPMMTSCPTAASNSGRIPATTTPAWSISSILRGSTTNNWFQDNGWREVIFYAVANACTSGTPNCTGSGYLTLNNSPANPAANQKVVVIATGAALSGQSRSGAFKNVVGNYLEGENLAPLDDVYTKNDTLPFNDIALSIP